MRTTIHAFGVVLLSSVSYAGLMDGLVAYYPFSGDANPVGVGPPTVVEGATLIPDRFGNPDSAYWFDGMNDRIVIGNAHLITDNTMSVQAWFKTSAKLGGSGQYTNPIVSKLFYGVSYCIGGTLDAANRIEFVVTGDGRALSDAELNDDQWHHVVGVYDGTLASGNVKLYVDGTLQSTVGASQYDIAPTDNRLAIGANVRPDGGSFYPNDFFYGAIDDVRIYDRALSSDEVRQLYIPDPATLLLLGLGGMMMRRRRIMLSPQA